MSSHICAPASWQRACDPFSKARGPSSTPSPPHPRLTIPEDVSCPSITEDWPALFTADFLSLRPFTLPDSSSAAAAISSECLCCQGCHSGAQGQNGLKCSNFSLKRCIVTGNSCCSSGSFPHSASKSRFFFSPSNVLQQSSEQDDASWPKSEHFGL